jgi:hypothetical protein
MVLSHADNDHACGLIGILKHFEVNGAIWMNRPWQWAQHILPAYPGYTLEKLVKEMRDKHQYLVEIEKIAASRDITINDVFQGTDIGPFKVLAPHVNRYVRTIPNFEKTPEAKHPFVSAAKTLFGEAVESVAKWVSEDWDVETLSDEPDPPTSDHNESSLVQLGQIDGHSVLLTGDVGPVGLNEAADYAQSLGLLKAPNLVQVPHHGSRKNVTPAVLDRWLGPIKAAFERRGYPVHATRERTKNHYHGRKSRDGWVTSTPEPWVSRIEA